MSSEPGADFSASYDTVTRTISAIVCVAAIAGVIAIHNAIAGAILILAVVLCYAYSPRGYRISAKAITVKRLIGNAHVPLENLRSIRSIEKDDLQGAVRLWGSGGLFGYFGVFRTTKLGRCTWYATNRKKLIVAIGVSKTTVFSPDDMDGFLNVIRSEVPSLTSTNREPSIGAQNEATTNAAATNSATQWLMLIMVLLAAAGALVAILLMLRARRGI